MALVLPAGNRGLMSQPNLETNMKWNYGKDAMYPKGTSKVTYVVHEGHGLTRQISRAAGNVLKDAGLIMPLAGKLFPKRGTKLSQVYEALRASHDQTTINRLNTWDTF